MPDTPNWQEITALIAGFALMGSVFLFATRSIVRDEVRRINGTYLRSAEAQLRFKQIEDHFDFLRDELVPLKRLREHCPLLHSESESSQSSRP